MATVIDKSGASMRGAHLITPRRGPDAAGTGVISYGPWVAGADTVTPIAIVGGRARIERNGPANPRIWKVVSNLIPGRVYTVLATHTVGTAGLSAFYRASTIAGLATWDGQFVATVTGPVNYTFTATASTYYIGTALGTNNIAEFCETSDVFTVQ